MAERKPINRDDLRSVLFLLILFVSVVGGREIGNYLSTYEEMTQLKVLFEVTEEELSRFLIDSLEERDTSLDIGYSITSPRADNSIDIVISQPDYVRRWLIGVTVSPIRVNQPEASDVDFEMLVEDVVVDRALYSFPKERVNYLGLKDREIQVDIDDVEVLREIVEESAEKYAGEVKVEFRGQVNVHLLFLDTWLPFQVKRHTLVRVPYLDYEGSEWKRFDGASITSLDINEGGYVQVEVYNPTRIHSIREDYLCEYFKEGIDEPVLSVMKEVSVAPMTEGSYVFPFRFDEPGNYTYRITSGDRVIAELDNSAVLVIN